MTSGTGPGTAALPLGHARKRGRTPRSRVGLVAAAGGDAPADELPTHEAAPPVRGDGRGRGRQPRAAARGAGRGRGRQSRAAPDVASADAGAPQAVLAADGLPADGAATLGGWVGRARGRGRAARAASRGRVGEVSADEHVPADRLNLHGAAQLGGHAAASSLAGVPQPPPAECRLDAAPSPLPKALDAALLPFQRTGVAFAIQRHGRVLIGDDMGLGKTIQAIAVCCAFRSDWPVLIVVPNSVRLVWADELERWVPDVGPWAVNTVRSGQDLVGLEKNAAAFHIVSYGILTRASPVRDFLRERQPFKIMVVDESHMIKSRDALRTKEILQIARRATRVLLLSGTPALARPVELYTQIEAVAPGLLGSFNAFTSRYCAPRQTAFGVDFTGAANLGELHSRLQPLMVRRLKDDVLTELPRKRRQRVQLEVDSAALATLVELREQSELLDQNQDAFKKRRLLMQMYKASSEAKIAPVCEYVEDLLQGGCKFLVFGHHIAMLDALEAAAVRSKAGFIRIDGSVNSAERVRRVQEFQSDANVRVAILGILAAGVGLTLTAASTVVFAELHWTPGILVQAEDRAHRIGQLSSVNVHYLVASGTIDDIIWPSVVHKVEVVSAICDGKIQKLVAELTPCMTVSGTAGTGFDGGLLDENFEDVDPSSEFHMDGADIPTPQKKRIAATARGIIPTRLAKESAFSVISMLQGRGPSKGPSRWACGYCGARNGADVRACAVCTESRASAPAATELPRRCLPSASKISSAPVLCIQEDDSQGLTSRPDVDTAACMAQVATVEPLHSFVVSRVTGRVHVLCAGGKPLGCNFKLTDWQQLKACGGLPESLCDPQASANVEAFLVEWSELQPTEQRQLVDQDLHLPLRPHLRTLTLSKMRYVKRAHLAVGEGAKDSAAWGTTEEEGGREGSASDAETGEASCAWCLKLLPALPGLPAPTVVGSPLQGRCCSQACFEKRSVQSSQAAIRWQIFALERGVCRVCSLDAHTLFKRIKVMEPPERLQELLRVGLKSTKSMLERPSEGMFWQADHIRPVAEGGGECDLANLRTLCTPCHARETGRLAGRLRCARWGANSLDVRACLQGGSSVGTATARLRRSHASPGVAVTGGGITIEIPDEVEIILD